METTVGCGEIKCPVEKGFGAAMETTVGSGEIKCQVKKGSGAAMETTVGCGEIKCPAEKGSGATMETTVGSGEIKCQVEKGSGAAMETTVGCGEIKCPAEKGSGATMKTTIGCGEIKCPATKMLYSQTEKHNKYAFPEYYYDQIQGVMAINDWPWCDTVVHTPYVTEVVRFYANPVYWKTDLFPKLERFYFNDFLPRLRLRTQGTLKRGEVDPVLVIPSCVLGLGLDMTLVTKSTAGSKKRKTLEA